MDFGGVTGGFQTPMNTCGIGDPIPFGINGQIGSGDLFGSSYNKKTLKNKFKISTKKAALNISYGIEPRPLIVMSKK